MLAEEVIQPLLSVEEPNASQESDTDCVEKQEEQMGIFQTLDRLEEAVDALLNAKSSASSNTLQHHLKAKNSKAVTSLFLVDLFTALFCRNSKKNVMDCLQ